MNPDLIGLVGTLEHTVRPGDCADHWANDLPVLATPILLWLAELAAMDALEQSLDSSDLTVGVAHQARHLGPSLVGARIRLRAKCTEASGRHIKFAVTAHDGERVVFTGTHERAILNRTRLMMRLTELGANELAQLSPDPPQAVHHLIKDKPNGQQRPPKRA